MASVSVPVGNVTFCVTCRPTFTADGFLDRGKAGQLEGHFVLAGRQRGQRVIAFTVTDGGARTLKGRAMWR